CALGRLRRRHAGEERRRDRERATRPYHSSQVHRYTSSISKRFERAVRCNHTATVEELVRTWTAPGHPSRGALRLAGHTIADEIHRQRRHQDEQPGREGEPRFGCERRLRLIEHVAPARLRGTD